jgi:hypothetical protein
MGRGAGAAISKKGGFSPGDEAARKQPAKPPKPEDARSSAQPPRDAGRPPR